MNSAQRKFGLMAAMMVMAAMGNEMPEMPSNITKSQPDWKRKKCKSCSKWRKYDKSQGCSIKPYMTPNNQSCEKYEKRK